MDQNRGREILRSLFKNAELAYFCENCSFIKICPIQNALDCPLKKAEQLFAENEVG
jgi:hypothetical protein